MKLDSYFECAQVEQSLNFFCPNLDQRALQRYRQMMKADTQSAGHDSPAGPGSSLPVLPRMKLPKKLTQRIAMQGDRLYQRDIAGNSDHGELAATRLPIHVANHAAAVLSNIRSYREFHGSRDWRADDIDTYETALSEFVVATAVHLWVVGRLLQEELAPDNSFRSHAIEWGLHLVSFLRNGRFRNHDSGKWLDPMTEQIRFLNDNYAVRVSRALREIERLMRELLLLFTLNVDATVNCLQSTLPLPDPKVDADKTVRTA